MSENNDSDLMKNSAEGTALSEANYLDTHYEAARETYEDCAKFANFERGWSILDAGAGGGSFIPFISSILGASGKITAIDIDAENIATIERRHQAGEFACPVESHIAGVTKLPFEDNTFDAIWCAAVQQYLTDEQVDTMLQEFKRVVRPGGLIAIKDWDHSGSVMGTDVLTYWHLAEKVNEVPMVAVQNHGLMRITKMPQLYAQYDIEPIGYKTFNVEWRYPVPAHARPFLETQMSSMGWLSSQVALPENEAAFWARWVNPEADDHFLNSPDYYTREAHGVAIGRKPA